MIFYTLREAIICTPEIVLGPWRPFELEIENYSLWVRNSAWNNILHGQTSKYDSKKCTSHVSGWALQIRWLTGNFKILTHKERCCTDFSFQTTALQRTHWRDIPCNICNFFLHRYYKVTLFGENFSAALNVHHLYLAHASYLEICCSLHVRSWYLLMDDGHIPSECSQSTL